MTQREILENEETIKLLETKQMFPQFVPKLAFVIKQIKQEATKAKLALIDLNLLEFEKNTFGEFSNSGIKYQNAINKYETEDVFIEDEFTIFELNANCLSLSVIELKLFLKLFK